MRKNVATFANVIDCVRHQISDDGVRIAEAPTLFALAWWPNSPDIAEQLLSDYGVPSGPKQLTEEFDAEVKAIHECLDKQGHAPGVAKWQKTKNQNARRMYASLNQRAEALTVWGHTAFPFRRRGDVVFRISAPREVHGGSPVIDALPVDDFIRGVSLQTVRDQLELVRLHKHLNLWRLVAGAGIVAVLFLVFT